MRPNDEEDDDDEDEEKDDERHAHVYERTCEWSLRMGRGPLIVIRDVFTDEPARRKYKIARARRSIGIMIIFHGIMSASHSHPRASRGLRLHVRRIIKDPGQ